MRFFGGVILVVLAGPSNSIHVPQKSSALNPYLHLQE